MFAAACLGADAGETQILAFQPGLHGVAGELGRNRLEDAKHAGDGHELGMKFLAEHPRAELTARPGVYRDLIHAQSEMLRTLAMKGGGA